MVSILSGSEAPWANIGRMSGDPKDQVCSLWLKTESKLTGFICHPGWIMEKEESQDGGVKIQAGVSDVSGRDRQGREKQERGGDAIYYA